jgi:hypothetical protein
MITRKNLIHFGLISFTASMMLSCGGGSGGDNAITESQVSDSSAVQDARDNAAKVQDIFYAVPSPMEMASMLKKVGATYDAGLLNDVKNVHEYTTARSQALNLGIYGADLSYTSVFNQNQESIIYLSCAKKLADNLGVTKAFSDETIERIETNVDNRDSLLNIVSETYYMLDAYLKENGRDHVSALVIAAGWIEGLYISTSIAMSEESPSDLLLSRIADQKLSLNNLVSLVEAYNSDNQIDDIVADLKTIEAAFDAVQVERGGPATGGDADVNVIGKTTKSTISPETLEEITKVVAEIRTRYVS